jgi:hypothetical protein
MNKKLTLALQLVEKAIDEAADIMADGKVTVGELADSGFTMIEKLGQTLAPKDWHKTLYTVNKKVVTPASIMGVVRTSSVKGLQAFGVYDVELKG